jgi:capsular polysaccharide biosynthesis protein
MVLKIIPQTISIRKPPCNIKSEDDALFIHEYHKVINQTTVSTLNNVLYLGNSLFHISRVKFLSSYTHTISPSIKSLLVNLSMIFRNGNTIYEGIWITDNWSGGYFHWLTDALPRLIACNDHIENHIILIPIQLGKIRFITDSLNLLGLNYEIVQNKVYIKKLLLPSHTAQSGNYNQFLLTQLRERFGIKNGVTVFRNIYISRKKSEKRMVSNEEELLVLLKRYHFEIHYFEEYSLIKQIEIMQQTKTLIGLHGSGLTNMLFMPHNGNVIELRNYGDAHNNCYFSLASDLNMNYYYQQCKGSTNDTHISDVTVPLIDFKYILEVLAN